MKIAIAVHRKRSVDLSNGFFVSAYSRVGLSEVGVSGEQIWTRRDSFPKIRNCTLEAVTTDLDVAKFEVSLLAVRLKFKDLPQRLFRLLVFSVFPVKRRQPQKRCWAPGFEVRRSLIMRNSQLPPFPLAVDVAKQNVTLPRIGIQGHGALEGGLSKVACRLCLPVNGGRVVRVRT